MKRHDAWKMKIKNHIKKIFFFTLWLAIIGAVMVLLVAAMKIKSHKNCKAVRIEITGVEQIFFLDQADIRKSLTYNETDVPEGKPVAAFNLQALEEKLEKNVWVKDAQLFFDNNMVLHVHISEREPVARIFTNSGNSFFIDSSCHQMPLSDKMAVRLPVFTGFPTDRKNLNPEDSVLMRQVEHLAVFIAGNRFFKAQVAQVNITITRNFEMIPTIGNHIVLFGDGENYESKFRRLLIFYKEVLSHTGFDKYSTISVQYEKQVIGTRKGFVAKIDSVQAIKNIQQLIEESKKAGSDTLFTSVEKNLPQIEMPDSTLSILSETALPVSDSISITNTSKSKSSPPVKKSTSIHPVINVNPIHPMFMQNQKQS